MSPALHHFDCSNDRISDVPKQVLTVFPGNAYLLPEVGAGDWV